MHDITNTEGDCKSKYLYENFPQIGLTDIIFTITFQEAEPTPNCNSGSYLLYIDNTTQYCLT
jgi:hypothetical protein